MDKGTLQDMLSDLRTHLTKVVSGLDDADSVSLGDLNKHLDDIALAANKADNHAETLEGLIDKLEDEK